MVMQEPKSLEDASAFRFCGLVLDARRRLLLDGERPLPLSGRALDILRVLLEHPGELVGKQTLMARVWPGAVVEDINLRVHISALRRVLRPYSDRDPILSARQRGYGFALAVERLNEADLTPLAETPLPLTPLEGRDTSLVELRRLLAQRRLVSVVGTGGVGKSLLVQHLLRTLEDFADGIQSLDLAALGHMMALVDRLASDLGLASGSGLPALQEALATRRLLLVLDNAERLVEPAAWLVENLLQGCPQLRVLVTSREALRVEGEAVLRLAPLPVAQPPAGQLRDAMREPAFRLFVRRARARLPELQLRPTDVQLVGEICRRSEGVPLALEILAEQVAALGLAGVLAQLDGGYYLSVAGRRTAAQRQRSLGAMLDWSLHSLSESEFAVLATLAEAGERFSRQQALRLAAQRGLEEALFIPLLGQLVDKSLILVEGSGAALGYRLLAMLRLHLRQFRQQPPLQGLLLPGQRRDPDGAGEHPAQMRLIEEAALQGDRRQG
ncbi:MAG TPA: winged helix-turn-helix domain-containing protein [Pseudomonas oryzihabitans]|nr:winged helix-turn-helix domain-containing protein [Pseudomonas oryzihabitans]HJE69979.1 winged helix-turn-helix domain-containing protein [Pseudomonas oryzihabitans]